MAYVTWKYMTISHQRSRSDYIVHMYVPLINTVSLKKMKTKMFNMLNIIPAKHQHVSIVIMSLLAR